MEENVATADARLRSKAIELSVLAVYGKPPFDNGVCASLNPVLSYISQMPNEEQQRALSILAKAAAFYIGGEQFRDQAALDELAKIKKNAPKKAFVPTPPRTKGWAERPIAIETMKHRYPDFRLDLSSIELATKSPRGVISFSSVTDKRVKALIALDFGVTPGPMGFSCSVGVFPPLFLMDIGAPCATGNYWPYFSAETFREALEKALNVVDIVLPAFLLKVAEA